MRVDCLHGYYKFTEVSAGEIATFANLFGLDIARSGDHFTFSDLADAPNYSIAGGFFLGCPTLSTFAGDPWDVMRANGLVYDFTKGLVVPKLLVTAIAQISQAGYFFISTGMLLAGSVTDDGSRVTDYAAFFVPERANFKYSEIGYE